MKLKNSTTTTAYENFKSEVKYLKKAFKILTEYCEWTPDNVRILTTRAQKAINMPGDFKEKKYLTNLIVRMEKIGRTI